MTTKKELTKKIAELQAQVDAMPDEPSGFWKPKYGEKYWSIFSYGIVHSERWTGDDAELYYLSQGNVFRTEEEAQHHKKKLEVLGKIRLAAMEDIQRNGEIDWGTGTGNKYRIKYHHRNKRWGVSTVGYLYEPTTIYFKTKAAAEKCLADLGSELDVLIGEV